MRETSPNSFDWFRTKFTNKSLWIHIKVYRLFSLIIIIYIIVAYVVNYVVRSYATVVYTQYIFERYLISVLCFQNRYIPFTHRKMDLHTPTM